MKLREKQASARVIAARSLLTFLKDEGVTASICGGYVRDTWHNKSIRDIDLYVHESSYEYTLRLLCRSTPTAKRNDESDAYKHQSIVRQEEHPLTLDLKERFGLETDNVNVIGICDADVRPHRVCERFNLGISQAGISQEDAPIYTTAAFRRDSSDKMMTLLRTGWGHEATMKAFIKLHKKYPWPLRILREDDFDFDFD
jgi:hypothetical protein